jgi:hypothetical protein
MNNPADVYLLDRAPDNLGPPSKSVAARAYALEMVAADPKRFQIVAESDVEPAERSDGRTIIEQATDQ